MQVAFVGSTYDIRLAEGAVITQEGVTGFDSRPSYQCNQPCALPNPTH